MEHLYTTLDPATAECGLHIWGNHEIMRLLQTKGVWEGMDLPASLHTIYRMGKQTHVLVTFPTKNAREVAERTFRVRLSLKVKTGKEGLSKINSECVATANLEIQERLRNLVRSSANMQSALQAASNPAPGGMGSGLSSIWGRPTPNPFSTNIWGSPSTGTPAYNVWGAPVASNFWGLPEPATLPVPAAALGRNDTPIPANPWKTEEEVPPAPSDLDEQARSLLELIPSVEASIQAVPQLISASSSDEPTMPSIDLYIHADVREVELPISSHPVIKDIIAAPSVLAPQQVHNSSLTLSASREDLTPRLESEYIQQSLRLPSPLLFSPLPDPSAALAPYLLPNDPSQDLQLPAERVVLTVTSEPSEDEDPSQIETADSQTDVPVELSHVDDSAVMGNDVVTIVEPSNDSVSMEDNFSVDELIPLPTLGLDFVPQLSSTVEDRSTTPDADAQVSLDPMPKDLKAASEELLTSEPTTSVQQDLPVVQVPPVLEELSDSESALTPDADPTEDVDQSSPIVESIQPTEVTEEQADITPMESCPDCEERQYWVKDWQDRARLDVLEAHRQVDSCREIVDRAEAFLSDRVKERTAIQMERDRLRNTLRDVKVERDALQKVIRSRLGSNQPDPPDPFSASTNRANHRRSLYSRTSLIPPAQQVAPPSWSYTPQPPQPP